MIKKRYLLLALVGIFFYGFFFHEPDVNETDAQKFLSIEVSDNNVDIDLAQKVGIHVDQDDKNQESFIHVGDAIKVQSSENKAAVNLLGIGSDIEESESTNQSPTNTAEVSLRSDNPMIVRAGNSTKNQTSIMIDGVGIGELYELDGHDLDVNGMKNIIKIKGNCGRVTVNGVANIVRVEGASSVVINGVGNRVYVDDQLVSDNATKSGVLNFVFKN